MLMALGSSCWSQLLPEKCSGHVLDGLSLLQEEMVSSAIIRITLREVLFMLYELR
jgi:hypothetical protein